MLLGRRHGDRGWPALSQLGVGVADLTAGALRVCGGVPVLLRREQAHPCGGLARWGSPHSQSSVFPRSQSYEVGLGTCCSTWASLCYAGLAFREEQGQGNPHAWPLAGGPAPDPSLCLFWAPRPSLEKSRPWRGQNPRPQRPASAAGLGPRVASRAVGFASTQQPSPHPQPGPHLRSHEAPEVTARPLGKVEVGLHWAVGPVYCWR